ncbi:DUF3572 domain-containing protein [Roseicyclus sp. F158]|uniref:DUF3572 domain-containing protein n=1 Tax=Tropicimonas omnivorans TaxID=3075590 RepID=A0ABU3DI83_9RHOB|nr:DUF3572 domain-containing protein [Roseicyclus sp. F158]MDT0682857.1 DUF3572 domain-containing protein [Roseicyclus sp. F158]
MSQDSAEILAIRALGWLAREDDLLDVFLGSSGLARDELAEGAADPEFLASVLDFVMMDDAWVMRFAEAENVAPETLRLARSELPGGALPEWT